jgi:transposase
MKATPIQRMDLPMDEWEALLQRAKAAPLDDTDCAKIQALFDSYAYLTGLVEDRRTTIDRLRKLLFGARTEKTRDVLATPGSEAASPGAAPDGKESPGPAAPPPEAPPPSGHGRHGAGAYCGAERVAVPHAFLKPGDRCPNCQKGKVYELAQPGVLVRIVGQAPVQAKVYELQKLRCNLCGQVFTADAPDRVGPEKYDATAASMIALLKYGSGLPFNRLAGLQGNLGLPLPASTQWDIVRDTARRIEPIHAELIRQAAQGEVLHNDDTTVKILELMGKRAARAAADGEVSGRRGMFTSGIVSTRAGRRIALFFTGRRHAGENLADVLAHRAAEWGPPIQMCGVLPAGLRTGKSHGCRAFS